MPRILPDVGVLKWRGRVQVPDVTFTRNTCEVDATVVQMPVVTRSVREDATQHTSLFSDLSLIDQDQALPLEWLSLVLLTHALNKPEDCHHTHRLGTRKAQLVTARSQTSE